MRFILGVIFVLLMSVNITADDRGFDVVLKEMKSEPRVALVIGNKDYTSLNSLKNPINDARDMADILRKKGFFVIPLENASQFQMEQAISQFSNKIRNGKGVGLFYYAGHGVEVGGVNYLIPSDARIPSIDFVKSKTVSIDSVISAMENAQNRFNILILDACRSNPFGRGGGGLAPINSATGIYVAYATAPTKIAEDGAGRNGLFTSYLKKYINQSGLKIEEVFKNVRREVRKASHKRQTPWTSSSVDGDFYFTLPNIQKRENNIITPIISNVSTKNSKVWALKKACKLDDGKACYTLGTKYYFGQDVSKDLSKTVELYKDACNLKYGEGCFELGSRYYYGQGVSKDLSKAVKLYRNACNLQYGKGCLELGSRYYFGEGVSKDLSKAVKLYRDACNLKYGKGCLELGTRYYYGQGVSKDLSKAVELYRDACNLKYGKGCLELGNRYYYGQGGLVKSLSTAREFYKKSCDIGYAKGCTAFATY